jgi:hypothetical protein
MSSRDSGRPLVDLMRNNDEAGTSGGAMNDEPADAPTDDDYNFFKYYDCFGCGKHI